MEKREFQRRTSDANRQWDYSVRSGMHVERSTSSIVLGGEIDRRGGIFERCPFDRDLKEERNSTGKRESSCLGGWPSPTCLSAGVGMESEKTRI